MMGNEKERKKSLNKGDLSVRQNVKAKIKTTFYLIF